MKIFVIFDHIQTERLNAEDANAKKVTAYVLLVWEKYLEFEVLFSRNLGVFLEICLFRIIDVKH